MVIGKLDAGKPHHATELHDRLLLLHERHLQFGVQHCLLEAHRYAAGEVRQIRRKVEVTQIDNGVGLPRRGKRNGLGGRVEPAAVQVERQARLDLYLVIGLQIAQERHTQVQVTHLMHFVHGPVVEVHGATDQRQVEQREPGGLLLLVRVLFGQTRQNVVDVVLAPAQIGQPDLRPFQLQGLHHRRQAQKGLCLGIGIQAREPELGVGAVLACNGKVMDGQLERPGFEVDLAHRRRPPELLADGFLKLCLYQPRDGQPGHDPKQGHACQQPEHPPDPLLTSHRGPLHAGIVGAAHERSMAATKKKARRTGTRPARRA